MSPDLGGPRRMSLFLLGAKSELPQTEFCSKCGGFQKPQDVLGAPTRNRTAPAVSEASGVLLAGIELPQDLLYAAFI